LSILWHLAYEQQTLILKLSSDWLKISNILSTFAELVGGTFQD